MLVRMIKQYVFFIYYTWSKIRDDTNGGKNAYSYTVQKITLTPHLYITMKTRTARDYIIMIMVNITLMIKNVQKLAAQTWSCSPLPIKPTVIKS